ncbi:Hypothetical protein SRAE_0000059600 [Strongyloides ratti]|uniref:Uncharacterized protein n=1 Tax=Strongyloides ratti TaxID=34506 RepID=A0A090L011_STRRB|nr:Hypothetical protein SRAE_0000059600 [Strongyloides ratti]CEF61472.1 Hypothetical protein SRAE_0000059600 [Strongyloides ratti]
MVNGLENDEEMLNNFYKIRETLLEFNITKTIKDIRKKRKYELTNNNEILRNNNEKKQKRNEVNELKNFDREIYHNKFIKLFQDLSLAKYLIELKEYIDLQKTTHEFSTGKTELLNYNISEYLYIKLNKVFKYYLRNVPCVSNILDIFIQELCENLNFNPIL